MQNCVCTNSAPAASLAASLSGRQDGGGSIGTSAAPRKNDARPKTLRPEGSSPLSRSSRAIAVSVTESTSNTALVCGWSPAFGPSPVRQRIVLPATGSPDAKPAAVGSSSCPAVLSAGAARCAVEEAAYISDRRRTSKAISGAGAKRPASWTGHGGAVKSTGNLPGQRNEIERGRRACAAGTDGSLVDGYLMSGVNEIRSRFLDYFAENGHQVVPSSPLVPRNDPTLMFTNAGMVQFKNVFTGLEKRPYTRAVTAQKCVRAGGKHNDLDNVGYTARHHTFFEMLGNFSFGDYFKDRAIELAWNLITKEFDLPKDRLMVTVYVDDDQGFDLWRKIAGLPESRIIRIAGSDNFWQMGDTGPCGPCSEIFYDHGDKIAGGPPGSPDAEGDRFIEIWNLVFMQFEQLPGGKRVELPKPSI